VVYGHGTDAISVSVDGRDLRHALSGEAGLNQLLNLEIGSDHHLALARALQRHPVRHSVLHVDFQIVRRDEVISADVPLNLVGEATAVEREKGIIEQPLTTLTVRATPADIPTGIEVNISDMNIGDGIRVGDLRLPSGVTTDVSLDEIVVIASIPRAAVEAAAEAEEAVEGEAAAEAAGAEGAAAAAAPAAQEASESEG
jgi:large subunit ribosomal protein L25